MTLWLTDLADVLHSVGLKVAELPGWQTASFPKWPGYTIAGTPSHVMVHHTASQTTPANDLHYITAVNPLHPITNLYLDRAGMFYVVAAGRVCTNGVGSSAAWAGGVPDDQMNHYAISIEAANNGVGEPWPTAQTDAYVMGCATLCKHYGIPVAHVRAHAEWSPGRKIDPAGPSPWATGRNTWDMDAFRDAVNDIITEDDDMQTFEPPVRVYDSRKDNAPLAPGEIRTIPVVLGSERAVAANLTVVPIANAGYLTAWNSAIGTPPATSNVNWSTRGPVANAAVIGVTNHSIKVRANAACHLLVDVQAVWP